MAWPEPGIGLIVTLIAGPWAAWMNTYVPGLLPTDAGQIMVGFTLGAWGLGGLAKREFVIPRSPLLIPLGLFVGWAAMTMLWARDLAFGLPEVIKWIEIILVMLLAIDVAQLRGVQWVLTGVFATAALQALIGIYEARIRGVGPLGFQLTEGVYRAYGTFEQPNPFAGFVGMVLPIAIALTAYYGVRAAYSIVARHWPGISHDAVRLAYHVIVTVVLAAGLYLSFSRGAWRGTAAAIGTIIVFALKRLWIGLALGAAASRRTAVRAKATRGRPLGLAGSRGIERPGRLNADGADLHAATRPAARAVRRHRRPRDVVHGRH